MPSLLDYPKFCEDLKIIESIKIMDKRNFHPNGLFSEQIFGPLKNYTCQCGTYFGPSRSGGTCEICQVDIVNSDERRRRFAKIELPIQVVNPVFYDLLVDIGGKIIKPILDDLMKKEDSVLYKIKNEKGIEEYSIFIMGQGNEAPETYEGKWEGLAAIEEFVGGVVGFLASEDIDKWDLIRNNLDKLLIQDIIVLPPDLRPAAKGVEKNNQIVDQINRYYMQILTKKHIMEETLVNINRDKKLFYNYFKQIQKDVNELNTHILEKLSKKEGLIRGNILGKRIDFSGRAVIIPDPTLNLADCILPYLMVLELFKLQISKKLIDISKFKLLNDAIDFVDVCIDTKNPILLNICEEIVDGEVCILNRQPSLHRLGMLGFNIRVSLDAVIKIHPLACPPFNADFDGDQMAVYIPITEASKQEVKDKFLITKNLSDPSNGSLTTTPSQDIILGIYMLTGDKFPDLLTKVTYKKKKITEGMKLFNECLPVNFPIIDRRIGKKQLIKILNVIKSEYKDTEVADILDNIKRLGFKYSTLYGVTMSLEACNIEAATKLKNEIYSNPSTIAQLNKVSSKETEDFLKENFHYSYMIDSGARGTYDQIRQIVLTRGFISNFEGEILKTPIKNSLLDGLDQQEFFNSTYGCRKGLLDVALNTGTSGYLSRKLIFTCANLQISKIKKDCGTTDYLSVHVVDSSKARMLIGRYFAKDDELVLITEDNYEALVEETILLRSPIYCKDDDLCQTCYGDLHKILDSRFVGVIAAQSCGECNTQLILRTFHVSGVAKIDTQNKDNDMKQDDIVGDLTTVSALLHQFKGQTPKKLTSELFRIYNKSRKIHHVHFECIVSQLMWHNDIKWRLLPDRDSKEIQFKSVQSVPSKESWLLGLAFSNPKRHILKGILNSGNYHGIMDKILCGEKIT